MRILLLIASIFALNTVKAQLYFNNTIDVPVYVAIVYQLKTKEFKGAVSKGWFKLIPGETKEVLNYNPNGELFYYAKSDKVEFKGKYSFLIHGTDAFNINNADKKYVKDSYPSYLWQLFNFVPRSNHEQLKGKYTIKF